jgi:hypothetical protein
MPIEVNLEMRPPTPHSVFIARHQSNFSFLQAILPRFYNSISNLPLLYAQTAGLPETATHLTDIHSP